jgi:hypothetical protein
MVGWRPPYHVVKHLSGPSFTRPGHSALHATAEDFSSPAPLVTAMPKSLL